MELLEIERNDFKVLSEKVDKILELVSRNRVIRTPITLESEIDDNWLDNEQVKKVLRISGRTLQRLRVENLIAYSKLKNRCRYHVLDIEDALRKKVISCSPETIEEFYQNYIINAK